MQTLIVDQVTTKDHGFGNITEREQSIAENNTG